MCGKIQDGGTKPALGKLEAGTGAGGVFGEQIDDRAVAEQRELATRAKEIITIVECCLENGQEVVPVQFGNTEQMPNRKPIDAADHSGSNRRCRRV